MLEFTSNSHAIKFLEDGCKKLVRDGSARCVKDSRNGEFETGRYIKDNAKKEELEDRNFGVAVYEVRYLIKVGSGLIFMPHVSDIRFWYDRRKRIAGFKISAEDLLAIINSATIVNILHKLDISLGGDKNGKPTLEKVIQLLNKTVSKIDPSLKGSFTARRYDGKDR